VSQIATPLDIDLSVLTALEGRLGRTSMIGLVSAHLRHGKAVMDRLRAMAGSIDRTELHAIGHQIVGSCGSIGLNGMSKLGGMLEDLAREAPLEALEELITATLEACHRAQAALAERYPEISI
jgi:HPt (histidine-containing phosphotransfer) domain-containing protein